MCREGNDTLDSMNDIRFCCSVVSGASPRQKSTLIRLVPGGLDVVCFLELFAVRGELGEGLQIFCKSAGVAH